MTFFISQQDTFIIRLHLCSFTLNKHRLLFDFACSFKTQNWTANLPSPTTVFHFDKISSLILWQIRLFRSFDSFIHVSFTLKNTDYKKSIKLVSSMISSSLLTVSITILSAFSVNEYSIKIRRMVYATCTVISMGINTFCPVNSLSDLPYFDQVIACEQQNKHPFLLVRRK